MRVNLLLFFGLVLASQGLLISCGQDSGGGSNALTDDAATRDLEESKKYNRFLEDVKKQYGNNGRREAFLYLKNKMVKCRADVQACLDQNPGPVPVDCEVSMWGKWSDCRNGQTSRTRSVEREPLNGGEACPVLMDTVDCNKKGDPIEEPVGFTAEEKEAFKQNFVTLRNIFGNADIKNFYLYMNEQLEACYERFDGCREEKERPINCSVSEWSDWSTCVDGQETRQRVVVVEPVNDGEPCPALNETRQCSVAPPPTAPPAYPTAGPPAPPAYPTSSYPSPPPAPPAYPTAPPAGPPPAPPAYPTAGPPAPPAYPTSYPSPPPAYPQ